MKKNRCFLYLTVVFLCCFLVSCGQSVGDSGNDGSDDLVKIETKDPDSYGESSLPDLESSSAFTGKSYLDESGWTAYFFNEDGTVIGRSCTGESGSSNGQLSYSLRQFKKSGYGTYTYNVLDKKMIIVPKGMFGGDTVFYDAEQYFDYEMSVLKQSAAVKGYTTVSIPQDWIDAKINIYKQKMEAFKPIVIDCDVSDGVLILNDSAEHDGDYNCKTGNLNIKIYLNDFDISIENGSAKLNDPLIYSMENGKFSGADYKWEFDGSTAILKKLGEFSGTYEIEYGSCYLKLTSVTGDIPYVIKNMVNMEYELKKNISETAKVYYPIRKTVNYTVIGSDDIIAIEKSQAFITDASMTSWTDKTFELLTSGYITGIYTNKECTRSIIGKELIDGGHVYIKLKNITAADYNGYMGNVVVEEVNKVSLSIQTPCTILFDANDGSGKTFTQKFNSGIPFYFEQFYYMGFGEGEKNGKYFAGWATEPNATEPVYDLHAVYSKQTLTRSMTVYAVWKNVLKLIIKDPSGECADLVVKNTDTEYSGEYVCKFGYVDTYFSRNGFKIEGFSKKQSATEVEIELNTQYKEGVGTPWLYVDSQSFGSSTELVLYIVWKDVRFPVIFETNSSNVIESIMTDVITELPALAREDYKFEGWFTSPDFSGSAVTVPYAISKKTFLYAKWRRLYTVTYNSNGGSEVVSVKDCVIQEPETPIKQYKIFRGWYSTESFSEESKITFPYEPESDVVLYAKWESEMVSISYNKNGATSGIVPDSFKIEKGTSFTVANNSGNLEKLGFIFEDWTTSFGDIVGTDYAAGVVITPLSDIILYAKWRIDYTTMIDVEGGSFYFSESGAKITLDSYEMAQYEVTYELYLEVYNWAVKNGYTMNRLAKGTLENDEYKSYIPACNFTWAGACVWLNAYSEYKNFEPVYYLGDSIWRDETSTTDNLSWNQEKNGFRLPTECEWEYAARGGENQKNYEYAGSNEWSEVANFGTELLTVGKKKPNSLGIYDMSGNVAEWCYDYLGSFGSGELTNPVHHTYSYEFYYRIVRGGSYAISSLYRSLSFRGIYPPNVSTADAIVISSKRYINYNNYDSKYTIGIRPVRNKMD